MWVYIGYILIVCRIFLVYILIVCGIFFVLRHIIDLGSGYDTHLSITKSGNYDTGTFEDFKKMYDKSEPWEFLSSNSFWKCQEPYSSSYALNFYRIDFGTHNMLLNRKDYKKYRSFLEEEIAKKVDNSCQSKAPWKNNLKVVK